eukprot:1158163-Pyramimonas_sp.AAC.1
MALPGAEGGMEAAPINTTHFIITAAANDKSFCPSTHQWRHAQYDFDAIKHRLRKHCRRQRAAPEWSLRADIWTPLLVDRSEDRKEEDCRQFDRAMIFLGPPIGDAILIQLAAARQP